MSFYLRLVAVAFLLLAWTLSGPDNYVMYLYAKGQAEAGLTLAHQINVVRLIATTIGALCLFGSWHIERPEGERNNTRDVVTLISVIFGTSCAIYKWAL